MPSLGLGLGLVLELKVGWNYMLPRSFFMLPSYKLTSLDHWGAGIERQEPHHTC